MEMDLWKNDMVQRIRHGVNVEEGELRRYKAFLVRKEEGTEEEPFIWNNQIKMTSVNGPEAPSEKKIAENKPTAIVSSIAGTQTVLPPLAKVKGELRETRKIAVEQEALRRKDRRISWRYCEFTHKWVRGVDIQMVHRFSAYQKEK